MNYDNTAPLKVGQMNTLLANGNRVLRTRGVLVWCQKFAIVLASLFGVLAPVATVHAQEGAKSCAAVTGACTIDSAAIEYVHKTTGVHFFTACREEKLLLDAVPAQFSKTGRTFPVWASAESANLSVAPSALARYFITISNAEAARHFQTVLTAEKAALDALTQSNDGTYCFERSASGYAIAPPQIASLPIEQLTVANVQATANCPAGSRPVWRMFNDKTSAPNGKVIAPQHRFTGSWAELQQTIGLNTSTTPAESSAANWLNEGVRMCVPGTAQWISLAIDATSLTPTAQQSGTAAYTLRLQVRNDQGAGSGSLIPMVALQLPPGMTYQSASVGTTCTADAPTSAGQRLTCLGASLLAGGTANLSINTTASTAAGADLTVNAIAVGSLTSNVTAELIEQLWPIACNGRGKPAYGCDKATSQQTVDTVKQAAAKLAFEGTLIANASSQSSSAATVTLSGLTLRAGSTTPVNVELHVEYQAIGSTTWRPVSASSVTWAPSAQVSGLAAPSLINNLQATINYTSSLPNPTVALRVCARVLDTYNLWDGGGGCTTRPANDGYTQVSESKIVNVGSLNSSVAPVLTAQNVSTITVQPGNQLPPIDFQVYRQSNSSPPTGEFSCNTVSTALGYSCAPSGSLLGTSTVAVCRCTTNQTAPSTGTYTISVSATAPGATSSGQASGSIQVYTPPVITDYSKLVWSTESIIRDSQTNAVTISGTLRNNGTVELPTLISVYTRGANTGPLAGGSVTNPAGGRTSIAAGASQSVTISVPTTTSPGTALFMCAVRTNSFGDVGGACTQSSAASVDASASIEVTVPQQINPYWAVRLREQTTSTASPTSTDTINLSSLAAGQSTGSTWLVGCYELQSGAGTVPSCSVTFKMADQSQRNLPANPLTLGTDFEFYFKGADANGNLTVCSGQAWSSTNGCTPIWSDALAVSSITVTIGTATKTVNVLRNIPPPPAVLTVTAPTGIAPVTSAGALPTLNFAVTRQNPSVAPTSPLVCTVGAPNNLGYSCVANGNIQTQTSATCACTPNPATAPTVSASQDYSVRVIASADAQTTSGESTATVSVQPVSANRGCTDDNTVPVIREIDFASSSQFLRELYPFSTVGDGISSPPSVAAIRLKVVAGGGLWADGGMQVSPGLGTSTAEAVISRCRGRFDAGGRENVIRLEGYTGPGNQNPVTFFPHWWVDPVGTPDVNTATLHAPGRKASDGWISDGIYYVNMRQTWCSAGSGGTCSREITGSGGSIQH